MSEKSEKREDRYCYKCGKKLKLQKAANKKQHDILYCPTAGPIAVEEDGWVKDTVNQGHLYEILWNT